MIFQVIEAYSEYYIILNNNNILCLDISEDFDHYISLWIPHALLRKNASYIILYTQH